MPESRFRHPLGWWQFYVACVRHAGSGVLGVIGDASTILGTLIFGVKVIAPARYAASAVYFKTHGYNEDLLIAAPLTIGCAILLLRLVAAPFAVYRDKPVAENASAGPRPRVKVSDGLVDVRNEPRSHLWITKFTATNYGEAVAINVTCDIPIPDTQRSMSFSFSELRRDDPQRFTPKLFEERKPWRTSHWAPLDTFLKDARLASSCPREGNQKKIKVDKGAFGVAVSEPVL
ncbi:MAG: hypothetical protein ACXW5U_16300 [Thermoanaerobaculia bacterium]